MRKILLTAMFMTLISPLTAMALSSDESHTTVSASPDQGAAYNWFDPAAWGTAGKALSTPGIMMPFNPAHPASWVRIVDPKTHADWHMAFTNPANYVQFMQPQFYMQFMDPNTWMAWTNPDNYATFMNPATYMWWMTPSAYIHGMDPKNYAQMMNPANYVAFMNPMTYFQWVNPTAYTIPGGNKTDVATSFDWNNWFKMFDPNTYAQQLPGSQPESTDPNTEQDSLR